jgi:hypothetical protein
MSAFGGKADIQTQFAHAGSHRDGIWIRAVTELRFRGRLKRLRLRRTGVVGRNPDRLESFLCHVDFDDHFFGEE